MPEGPEIRRAADRLEAAICGKTLTEVWFAFPALQARQHELIDQRITEIETRGKAMLTHFSNGLTLYSHNQLYGVWRVVPAGPLPDIGRSLRVKLAAADTMLLLYSASEIALLDAAGVAAHPFLNRIGPDVLDSSVTVEQVRERLLSKTFRRRQFSALLLDQHFLAGLGNYLRVEILWQAGLAPHHRAADLSDEQMELLCDAMLTIPRCSYLTRGKVDDNVHHGAIFSFKVFHRAGEPCPRCGGVIVKTMQSSRPFYSCPVCQT